MNAEVEYAKAELEKAAAKLREAQKRASQERDLTLGSVLHSLEVIDEMVQASGARNTLREVNRWSGRQGGYRSDGSYFEIRRKISELLKRFDILDDSGRVKLHGH